MLRPPTWTRFAILCLLAGGLAGGALAAERVYLPEQGLLPGLRIDGTVLPHGTDARAFVEARAKATLARRVQVLLEGRVVGDKSLGELGVTVDVERVVQAAWSQGKGSDLLGRVEVARRARAGDVDVPLVFGVDRTGAMPYLVSLKENEDLAPVSARLDLSAHAVISEKPGKYIDADGALAAFVAVAGDARAAKVELPTVAVMPRVSGEFIKKLDIGTVVSEYETYFSRAGDQQKRGKNIDNGAAKLDGLVLAPGELLSFNSLVGERSEENGFQKSWEIFKGEMIEGIGGGTCQVASTFHAVAFFAGLDIIERLPHSRPSAYIPMGLDSTVVFPIVDLKVRNPHPFPVVLHAKTEGNKLRMELLGASKPVTVSFGRDVVETVPYKRKIVEDAAVGGKKVLVKQHGIKGYRVKRTRTLVYADGRRHVETNTDYYPPTTEIYQVPPGFDVSVLPPLPDADGDDPAPAATATATASPGAPTAGPAKPSDAVACAGDCAKPQDAPAPPEVEFVDAPGAHAPTQAQANPQKSITLKR
jgi:vancomycin resistance protein YoaR